MKKLKFYNWFVVAAFSFAIVLIIDVFTNRLDIANYWWDFKYYIAMAEKGFNARPLLGPFCYRYPTMFIAGGLASLLGVSTEIGFKAVAYLGAMCQLTGIFFFVYKYTKSQKGAYIALLVTSFSICNVKYLMFDVYRPDHLAYAFVMLATYLCLTSRFYLLLITIVIGVQFREFAILPFIACIISHAFSEKRKLLKKYVIPTIFSLFIAIVVPRLLIHASGSVRYVSGIRSLIMIPMNFSRDLNLAWSIIAYFLPTMMLLNLQRFRWISAQLSSEVKRFMLIYSILLLFFCLYGGTDLARFVTYYLIVQGLLIGLLCRVASWSEIIVMVIATIFFNRILMYIPIWNFSEYLDFFNGYEAHINWTTFYRFMEVIAYVFLGYFIRWIKVHAKTTEQNYM